MGTNKTGLALLAQVPEGGCICGLKPGYDILRVKAGTGVNTGDCVHGKV